MWIAAIVPIVLPLKNLCLYNCNHSALLQSVTIAVATMKQFTFFGVLFFMLAVALVSVERNLSLSPSYYSFVLLILVQLIVGHSRAPNAATGCWWQSDTELLGLPHAACRRTTEWPAAWTGSTSNPWTRTERTRSERTECRTELRTLQILKKKHWKTERNLSKTCVEILKFYCRYNVSSHS